MAWRPSTTAGRLFTRPRGFTPMGGAQPRHVCRRAAFHCTASRTPMERAWTWEDEGPVQPSWMSHESIAYGLSTTAMSMRAQLEAQGGSKLRVHLKRLAQEGNNRRPPDFASMRAPSREHIHKVLNLLRTPLSMSTQDDLQNKEEGNLFGPVPYLGKSEQLSGATRVGVLGELAALEALRLAFPGTISERNWVSSGRVHMGLPSWKGDPTPFDLWMDDAGGDLSGVPDALLLIEVKGQYAGTPPDSKAILTPSAVTFAKALWAFGNHGVYEVSEEEATHLGIPQLAGRKLVYVVIVVNGVDLVPPVPHFVRVVISHCSKRA